MKKETYESMIATIKEQPLLAKGIPLCNNLITKAIYIAYPCLLIYLLFFNPSLDFVIRYFFSSTFSSAFLVPLVSFVALSIFRKAVNSPRPYEVFETAPLIPKNTKGKSFPSRHVFSIFLIGTTFYFCCPIPEIGILILILGVLLACLRVVSGVHFIKDVITGALLGILMAELGFYLF